MSERSFTVPVIGYIRSPLRQKFGIPRQPNLVPVPAVIELLSPYDTADAAAGLDAFSHLWLIWRFHQAFAHGQDAATFRPKVRPPRLGGNAAIGVFASRSMQRPAGLGLSVVQLKHVDITAQGVRLAISGADLLDGTPIIDIKPYLAYSDAIPTAQSSYAAQAPETLPVIWTDDATKSAQTLGMTVHQLELITQLLALDPRPAFHQTPRQYTMRYADFDIQFEAQLTTQQTWLLQVVGVVGLSS